MTGSMANSAARLEDTDKQGAAQSMLESNDMLATPPSASEYLYDDQLANKSKSGHPYHLLEHSLPKPHLV